jgi:hypothetical protein
MSQNLITLTIPPAKLAAITAAIETLENEFSDLVELSTYERRHLIKMGDKSEAFCRQTLTLLDQNRQMVPPSFNLADAQSDLATHDLLRPLFTRLRQLISRADSTEMALGSDIMSAALEGYALAQMFGKGAELEALRETMSMRLSRKGKSPAPNAD